MYQKFKELGVRPADILVPRDCDLSRWAVVACDQFTSQADYWDEVEKIAGDAPSTLHLMLPEVYLNAPDLEERYARIGRTMDDYLEQGIFKTYHDSIFFQERTLPDGSIRLGIIAAVDLEQYDYTPGVDSLLRATEGTMMDRLPPRVRIRENASLEVPHVVLVIDDQEKTCIEPLAAETDQMEPVYDFDLMMGGGHIRSWRLTEKQMEHVADSLTYLASPAVMERKYGFAGLLPMLFAVGDGNHSLATAKTCYEAQKRNTPEDQWASLPSRYALVEIENLHCEGLQFKAIHRLVFDVDPEHLLNEFKEFYPSAHEGQGVGHTIEYEWEHGHGYLTVPNPRTQLATGTLQNFLDAYIQENGGRVDYIHGGRVVDEMSLNPRTVGFCLPALNKKELFKIVISDGVLPRKTFSMGKAKDKRYYLECRKIR